MSRPSAEPLLSERPLTEPHLVEQLLPEQPLGWVSSNSLSENGFSRTVSLKQPGSEHNFSENNFSENNFSENNFSQTARTNCEDEPRITSLRTPFPSSLRARTCTSQKGFSTQIVWRKGSVARHRHPAAIGFGLPSTNQAQDEYTCNNTAHAVAKFIDLDHGVAGLHGQTTTNNTIHMRCRRHTHWAHAPLPRREK